MIPKGNILSKPGDCIISGTPSIDHIHYYIAHHKEWFFNIELLDSYLSFLELLVLHDRLIYSAPYGAYDDVLNSSDFDSPAMGPCFDTYHLNISSEINLENEVLDLLRKKNILFQSKFEIKDLSPSKTFHFYSSIPELSKQLSSIERFAEGYESDKTICQRISLAYCSKKYGFPLFLTEFAGEGKIPFYMNNYQFNELSEITEIEKSIQKGVIPYLKNRLDSGAKNEIFRIEELGFETIFPKTPIAAQILLESKSPEDLLSVALSIRHEYRSFRQEMSKIEKEIFDPEINIQQKVKGIKYLEEIADELWPESNFGYRQVTSEVSSVSNLALNIGSSFSIQDVPTTIATISRAPWELLKKYFLRRKVKVLLQSKKAFLGSRENTIHISKMFKCSEELVKKSYSDYKR